MVEAALANKGSLKKLMQRRRMGQPLEVEGRTITSEEEKAEVFSETLALRFQAGTKTGDGRAWDDEVTTTGGDDTAGTEEEDVVLTIDTMLAALQAMRTGKAADGKGLVVEVIKAAGDEAVVALLEAFQRILDGEAIPGSWQEVEVVMVPKDVLSN